MRMARFALLALPVSLVVATLPAAATTTNPPVGGSLMARRGTVVAVGSPKLPPTVAASWLVADLDTGAVLGTRDPHGRFAPASTLKTLTAETLIPKLDPTLLVKPTFDDLNVDGSKVGLVQQLAYPVSQLFTAMLVVSGNDAANTLASANGGIAKTVAEMNAEAGRLQAFDTHAENANGLDHPKQLSSAYDLALIARAAMKLPDFRSYVATKRSAISGPGGKSIQIASHDRLLWNYDGAIGIKNGYTDRARATFVGAATRGGHTLVVTLMRTDPRYWPEAAALLDWGFAAQKAGVQPIGQLVDPYPDETALLSAPEDAIAIPVANHQRLAKPERLEEVLAALGVVLLGFLVIARRRRRA
jgi:D-alanyl-D-alanine carboxypeptidase (penicillin-binding protein 5/6)